MDIELAQALEEIKNLKKEKGTVKAEWLGRNHNTLLKRRCKRLSY